MYTVGSSQEHESVPAAHVRVQADQGGTGAVELTTDAEGKFSTAEIATGRYEVRVEFNGLGADPANVVVESGKATEVNIAMTVAEVKQEVTVTAQTDAIQTSETSSQTTLQKSTVEHAPNINERFESLLPMIPGVVRGPDGLINMKGAKASQGAMLVNSANVADPVTGSTGMRLPIDVVSSAQVIENPYDPEYGKLAGAVATIGTSTSAFDKFHYQVQNFLPRMRTRDGSIMGVEGFTPRMTVTGPLVEGRVAITQSFEYRYVRTPVDTLPPLKRDTNLESFDSYTQLDVNLNERQNASFTLAIYPQKLNYLGLNTFNTQESTPDFHQRGYMAGASHKLATASGGLLSSQLSYKVLDADIWPNSTDPYRLEVETTTGGYFDRQDRNTSRLEWQEVYSPHAWERWGQHQPKIGIDYDRNAYDGHQSFSPVEVVGTSGDIAERIDFTPGTRTSIRQHEFAAFAMDRWTIQQKVTLDAGVRLDHDSVSDNTHVAPRLGFAIAPFTSGRTVIRGGIGMFYDRINLNIPTFLQLPNRTVTTFGPDGLAMSEVHYVNRLSGPLDNPRSVAWNVEIEQQALRNLVLRAAYSQRYTVHDFFLEPSGNGSSAELLLHNTGKNSYREYQLTARYLIRKQVLNASYVHSSAVGDLNDFNQFFGNLGYPIIHANERAPLNFDAPDRFLFWSQFEARWKITLVPILDVHTGFPYSIVNEERDYIGARNRAGRYPVFSSLDFQVTKAMTLPFRGRRLHAQAGVRVFNVLNHYNPRDIQNDVDSARYGAFLNSVDRMVRGKFVINF